MYRGRGGFSKSQGGGRPNPTQYQYDQEMPQTSAPQQFQGQPRKQQQRSKQQRARDAKRRDEFRENGKPIKEKEQEIKDLINKTLFFGFKEAYEAQVKQEFSVIKTAVTLPITTRSIGLTTQAVFSKAYSLYRNIPLCTPWAFYRVSLGQVELKLLSAMKSQVLAAGFGQDNLFTRPRMSNDFKDLIRSTPVNIAPIANTIHAIGNFECTGKQFYVKPLNHPCLGILLSNLRNVVEMMSNANTPIAVRRDFYDHNPLPFAEWTLPAAEDERRRRRIPAGAAAGNPNHPLLLNADAIMPPDYGVADLEDDINHYQNFVSHLGRKNSSMLSGPCAIDYDGSGQRRQLTSNYCTGLRNPPTYNVGRPLGAEEYAAGPPPTGNLDEFWASEALDANEMFVGALNLLGEIPNAELMNRAQATRCVSPSDTVVLCVENKVKL